ncbi:MAG: hypothetical protein H0V93_11915 [Euzebyales bacterium]|nr:hypothetical protein [Euzebyales bacterium]
MEVVVWRWAFLVLVAGPVVGALAMRTWWQRPRRPGEVGISTCLTRLHLTTPPMRGVTMAKAMWNGAVIAESDDTIVVEGDHYFPGTTPSGTASTSDPEPAHGSDSG